MNAKTTYREQLTQALMRHVARNPDAVRHAMFMLGGRTIRDFDNRQLASLLSYLNQPVLPREARHA